MTWNFNIDEAPRGNTITEIVVVKGETTTRKRFVPDRVLVASPDCGAVIFSNWIPLAENGKDGNRWNNLGSKQIPLAWQHIPPHPNSHP